MTPLPHRFDGGHAAARRSARPGPATADLVENSRKGSDDNGLAGEIHGTVTVKPSVEKRMAKSSEVHLSLVIPAFNEEARIGNSLDRILSFLRSQPYSSEIIIVDDGSKDGTVRLIREKIRDKSGVQVYQQPRNLGKGAAIRQGILLTRGEYLFFSDADLSVSIETLSDFLPHLENGSDIVIGTRKNAGAVIEVHQPFYRSLMGKVYTELSNLILGLTISDFTCGFKGFRRNPGKDLFSRQLLTNWSFDAELLYLASLKGYRVQEIPVRWRNDEGTKVRLWKDVLTSFIGLLRIRIYDCLGRYL
jgi:dolichyl-phosphate beta-glucosyltransferase